jgi:hypothetical protein
MFEDNSPSNPRPCLCVLASGGMEPASGHRFRMEHALGAFGGSCGPLALRVCTRLAVGCEWSKMAHVNPL